MTNPLKIYNGVEKIIIPILIFLFAFSVLAKTDTLPDAGLTPDSPFYFLKTWKESIQTFFTFGEENKAKQYLHLAEVRLSEYQKMMEKGKTEIAQRTLEKYEKQLNHALDKLNQAKEKGKDVEKILETVSQATLKHQEVLLRVYEKVSEQAKKGIENALEKSLEGYENAIKAISKEKKEKLLNQAKEIKEKIKEKTKIMFKEESACQDLCGDGTCQEVVCMAVGCPCPETKESCPQDCAK